MAIVALTIAASICQAQTLVVGSVRDAVTLDPAVAVSTTDYIIIESIYERLVRHERTVGTDGEVTASLDFAPGLATSWEVSEDGLSWTFHLREGVMFHDDTPFNADAVAYSFSRVIEMGSGLAWQLSDALNTESIEVVDDHTITFHLTRPFAPFLEVLRLPIASIVSPSAVEANGGVESGRRNEWMANNAVGTGPFKLESRENDVRTVVVANRDYWGVAPQVESIVFRMVPDPSTLRLLVSRGEINIVALGLSWLDMNDLENMRGINLYIQETFPEIRIAPFNVEAEPFDNVLVRRAFSHAVDYQAIIDGVMFGRAKRLTSAIPEGVFGHDATLEPYRYDPERARELLAEAGYPEGFTFEFAYPSADQERYEVATIIQANLAQVGVRAELVGYAWPALLEKWGTGDYLLSVGKWAPVGDPHARVYGLLGCDSFGDAGNYGRYCNERVDELMNLAVETVDRDARAKYYEEMQSILMEDAPWIFLYQPVRAFPMTEDVSGFHIPPVETFAWEYVRLE